MWARPISHAATSKLHSISATVYGGATITRCRGSWPTSEPVETHDDPKVSECCAECVKVLASSSVWPGFVEVVGL